MRRGAVRLLEHMGSDLTVVNAARVSFAKEVAVVGGRDEKLLSYLARNGHWTPFSQPQLSFRIRMPIFVARQWFKHQVGFTRNETSRRYVDDEPEFYMPLEWRGRPTGGAKQGSSGPIEAQGRACAAAERVYALANEEYADLLALGVAPEQARMVLPQAMYTEFIETGSLYAYSRLCRLRLDPHVQWETRHYAEDVSALIEPLFPVSWPLLLSPPHHEA